MQKRKRAQKALSEPKNGGLEQFNFLAVRIVSVLFSATCENILGPKNCVPTPWCSPGGYLLPRFWCKLTILLGSKFCEI
jgi:hypothetical protein